MKLNIKLFNESIKLPTRAHATDAGLDIYSPEDFQVRQAGFRHVKLGLGIQVPAGHVGLIQGKSGLASKEGIFTIGNVIDEGYTGEISVTLVNHGNEYKTFHVGDKICQLLIIPVKYLDVEVVSSFPETARGSGGFGSTGK